MKILLTNNSRTTHESISKAKEEILLWILELIDKRWKITQAPFIQCISYWMNIVKTLKIVFLLERDLILIKIGKQGSAQVHSGLNGPWKGSWNYTYACFIQLSSRSVHGPWKGSWTHHLALFSILKALEVHDHVDGPWRGSWPLKGPVNLHLMLFLTGLNPPSLDDHLHDPWKDPRPVKGLVDLPLAFTWCSSSGLLSTATFMARERLHGLWRILWSLALPHFPAFSHIFSKCHVRTCFHTQRHKTHIIFTKYAWDSQLFTVLGVKSVVNTWHITYPWDGSSVSLRRKKETIEGNKIENFQKKLFGKTAIWTLRRNCH